MNVEPWTIAAGAVLALLVVRRLLGGGKVPSSVVKEKIDSGATIVDVRTPREFGRGAYPGALNIPVGALATRLREIPSGRPVVVYCASGVRSASAARILRQAGWADVVNAGGLHHMPR